MSEPSEPTYIPAAEGADLDVTQSMVSLFPTLVVNHHFEGVDDMNAALLDTIEAEAATAESVDTSNVGGFHSGPDFLLQDVACIAELRTRLQGVLVQLTRAVLRPREGNRKVHFELQGWANRLMRNDYHAVHSHPNYFWSGIYFLTDNPPVPEHPLSGKLELMDPRSGASISDPRDTTLYGRYLVDPRAGQLLIFPSWLMHCVHPYQGEQPRVSIGFNVDFRFRA